MLAVIIFESVELEIGNALFHCEYMNKLPTGNNQHETKEVYSVAHSYHEGR